MICNINLNAQIATRVFYNPSFELPATGCSSNWSQIPQTEVTGWKTTDTGTSRTDCGATTGTLTNPIEIWTTGFLGVNAQSGNQFAEINATINGYLYQNVCMLPNETFNYSIWHHRRETSGTDTMRARITDSSGTLITETSNLSSTNNSWNNFTGTLSNNGTAGTRRFGYVAISTATGDISVGNLIDNTSFSIRPLVDIRQFNSSTILENGGTGNLEVYVNGTLRSSATVVLTKTGTATITTDYTVGSPSRGSASVDASGNITLTLPAGDYDPNFSSGTSAGLITIPFTAVNDGVSDNNETAIYTVGTVSGGGGGTASLDLIASISGWSAACSTAVSTATLTIREPSDLTIAKSHTGSFTVGSSGTYSFTVSNIGGTASSGTITVTDTLPTGLTVNGGAAGGITEGGTNAANWTCNSNATSPQVITCTSSTAIATSGSSVFNFNVDTGLGTTVGTNSVTNSATVSGGGEANTSNDSSSDPTTILSPNLTIAKADTGSFTVGSTGTYQITVGNSGTAATSGTITVSDTLPTGLTVSNGALTLGGTNSANWSCSAASNVITCTSSTAIATSGSSVFTFNVNVGSNTPVGTNSLTNAISVSGGNEATANNGNNTGSDTTTVLSPDLTIAKSHSPTNFVRGSTGAYTLTVSNGGTASTSGTITVTDTLPTGLSITNGAVTLSGTNAANWSCSSTSNVITCTSSTAIATSGSSVFSFSVNVASNAAASVTNNASVSGGGEATANNGNNSASDPTPTVAVADLTLAKSHTGSFTVGNTGNYSFTVTNSGLGVSSGTITVTDTLPSGLTVNSGGAGSVTLGGTNAANWSCNSNAASPQVITCTSSTAIAASGTSIFNFNVNVGLGTAVGTNSVTNNASVSGGGQTNTANDSATDPTTILSPNLTIAKSHTGNFTRGSTGTYTLTIGNSGTAATSGTITVTDTLPTGLSVSNGALTLGGTNSANWSCSAASNVITCTSSTAIATSGSSVFTFSVNVASNAASSVTNNASVSGGNEATANNGNNSTTDPTTTVAPPDLTLAKSHTGSFTVGSNGTYSFTVTNSGGLASSGTITVSDTLPSGLTVNNGTSGSVTIGGTNAANWTCNSNAASPQVITCTSSTAIAASGTSVFNFAVNVGLGTAVGTNSITNSASVSGGGESDSSNNSATDPTTILSPNLTLSKSHSGSFTVGSTGNYSLTVGNSGTASTSGTITVSDTLPTGLTVNGGAVGSVTLGGTNAANWTCNSNAASPQVITCTSSTAIATSGSSIFNFNVNVGLGTAVGTNSITNSGSVSGGNEATANNGNNSATDPTTVISPNLMITKSHTGSFTVGSTGNYTLTIGNSGTASTNGTITVTDTLPTGLTVNGGAVGSVTPGGTNGANWTCNSNAASPQVITCTSSTAIAASGSSVFNFNVNVGLGTALGTNSITNSASVSGGREATANNTDNSTTDPTTVLSPDLTVAKSHTGNFTRGATGTYTLTVGNSGTASTSGTITLTDTLPTGLNIANGAVTLSGTNAANWSCTATSNVITCTSSTAIATSGSSVFSFTVNVASNAAASVTNTVSVSGGNEATVNNGNNSGSDPTTINSAPPNVTLVKSCPSPSNCTTAPQLPGTDVTYKIDFANIGGSGANNLAIVDSIPNYMDYKISSASTTVGTTGLTFTIEFSSDYDTLNPTFATWTYTPVSGAGGASAGYDRNVKAVRWRVTSGTLSNVSPNNAGYIAFVTKIR